jgi:hypothetical protein
MQKKWAYYFLGLLVLWAPLYGQQKITYTSQIDWDNGAILLNVFCTAVTTTGSFSPKVRHDAERVVIYRLPTIALDALSNIIVDSANTISNYYEQDSSLRQRLNDYVLTAQLTNSQFTTDFKTIRLDYSFAFYGEKGLFALFTYHKAPFPLYHTLGQTITSSAFTGIVIYAKGEHAAYGKQGKVKLAPSFFPRLYDEEMNLILGKEMCDPEAVKKWGLVAVTTSLDLAPYTARIGAFPMKIMLRKVYGINNTDLIISMENAAQLLTVKQNKELLRQGKIVIIYEQLPNS